MPCLNIDFISIDSKQVCYLSPDNIKLLSDDPDLLIDNMGDGGYYFVQLGKDTEIKRAGGKTFPKNGIFFLKKLDSETAHTFLAEMLLQLPKNNLLSAGELSIKDRKFIEWKLKSGAYWKSLQLDDPDKYKIVGLPAAKFTFFKPANTTTVTAASVTGKAELLRSAL